MFSLFSAFVNQKELKVMKLENYYICFLIYTSERFWDKLLQCSAFLAPINLNSPVALRLKYPYHDIKPWKIISAQHGIFFRKCCIYRKDTYNRSTWSYMNCVSKILKCIPAFICIFLIVYISSKVFRW